MLEPSKWPYLEKKCETALNSASGFKHIIPSLVVLDINAVQFGCGMNEVGGIYPQDFVLTAQWFEQWINTVSFAKREVRDKEFQFHLTFISCLWVTFILVPDTRYFFSYLICTKF